jgi:hypothetical protein
VLVGLALASLLALLVHQLLAALLVQHWLASAQVLVLLAHCLAQEVLLAQWLLLTMD